MKPFFLCLLLCAEVASSAVISVSKLPNSDTSIVVLSGPIERSDAVTFAEKVSGIAKAIVVLDSPGGSVLDGISIGRSVRANGYDTAVPDQTLCASSCALIWLAGTRRFAEESSVVGFHAAYVYRQGKAVEVGAGNALIGSYLNNLGLSDRAIIFVTSAPPEGIERLDRRKGQQVGIAYESLRDVSSLRKGVGSQPPITREMAGVISNSYDPVAAASRFYRALSAADGSAASALVLPAKRGFGPFNEKNIASFFSTMSEPLVVQSVQQLGQNLVEVKYTYRVTKIQCVGLAKVSTEYVMGNTLISGIKANC